MASLLLLVTCFSLGQLRRGMLMCLAQLALGQFQAPYCSSRAGVPPASPTNLRRCDHPHMQILIHFVFSSCCGYRI